MPNKSINCLINLLIVPNKSQIICQMMSTNNTPYVDDNYSFIVIIACVTNYYIINHLGA